MHYVIRIIKNWCANPKAVSSSPAKVYEKQMSKMLMNLYSTAKARYHTKWEAWMIISLLRRSTGFEDLQDF